jgi:nitrite reductase/ring-hydroxylating ferredoxin subunit
MNKSEPSRPALPAKPAAPAAAPSSEPGRFFRYMADFVGFTDADEQAIVASKPVIEKQLPQIVSDFYDHLLRYPPTRKFFLKPDGTLDEAYLQLRMRHNANFWRRTAEGNYDDEYAGYIAYVGRAHTTHGADPTIYIPERYVIGQVGFVQHAISQALHDALHDRDEMFEHRAMEAWDKLLMVVLEILARAYSTERETEKFDPLVPVDNTYVARLAQAAVDMDAPQGVRQVKRIAVARTDEIPDGERKLLRVEGISIGIFHLDGQFYALRNSCLHRGGPVCAGPLIGKMLECPWHGFQYNVTNGELIVDPKSKLDTFAVHIENEQVILEIPQ